MKTLHILAIIFIFILVGSFFIHSLDSINQDIGRHLKSGEIIWETKSVYKTNLFSYTEPEHRFINHHWLSEVVFYGLESKIGLEGLVLFKTIILLLAFLFLYKAIPHKNTPAILIAMLIGVLVFFARTDVRPEIFSYLFLSFFLFAIFRAKYLNEVKYLYALPFIQILWTNMHIYFALGPILVSFFLFERMINLKFKIFNLKKGLWIFVLVILATLINPNFITGALYPLQILSNYGYSIVENQNIFFLKSLGISSFNINLFQLSLVALITGFIIAIKNGVKNLTFEFLLAFAFSILAMKMFRNLGIYALMFIPVMGIVLSSTEFLKKKQIQAFLCALIIFISVFLTINVTNNNFYRWAGSAKQFGLIIPKGAEGGVEFLKANNIKGPVFNNFDVGSYLIWKLPEEKVFIDGRPEAYSVDFIQNIYIPMQLHPEVWEKYSKDYGINYIFFDHRDITPWAQSFLSHISENPKWARAYLDDWVVIFLKDSQ